MTAITGKPAKIIYSLFQSYRRYQKMQPWHLPVLWLIQTDLQK
mgnify:CR=1 FL=1